MSITRPRGFRAAAATAGLKESGNPDLALIVCDEGGAPGHPIKSRRSAAAVFTRNVVVGAPVEIGRAWRSAMLAGNAVGLRALLVNAGSANAATGTQGLADARACMAAVAHALACDPGDVLPSSTGVIGRRLDVDKIVRAIPTLAASLSRGEAADAAAAHAIMTTDLVPKSAHREIEIRGHQVHLGAIAKGSGMIAPRLDAAPHATMLAFITTDACVDPPTLQHALESASRLSFDRVSVDAHPSCSDTAVVLASGAAPVRTIHAHSPEYHAFAAALTAVCLELAEKIVADGEGATRVFRVTVRGALSDDAAERIARAVVDSPLVKCAVHGGDPNWGRILTAAGNAGVPFNPDHASLTIGGIPVFAAGRPTAAHRDDPALRDAMSLKRIEMELTIGDGPASAWLLGCDLSNDYVRINAQYTT